MQLEEANAIFRESYILQTSVGDLPSASEGFDTLVRSRRGTPWTGDTAVAAIVETTADTWRNKSAATGGGGDDSGNGGVALDALEAFVERDEGVVREFTARAASNFAYANSEVSSAASRVTQIG